MPEAEYGAVATDDVEAANGGSVDESETTPFYQFMVKLVPFRGIFINLPFIIKDFFPEESNDTGLTVTIVCIVLNVAAEYYWYTVGLDKVPVRIITLMFLLSFGTLFLLARFPVSETLKDHIEGDWLDCLSTAGFLVTSVVFWAAGYPFVHDMMAADCDDKAQYEHPIFLHSRYRWMVLWVSIFAGWSIASWWVVVFPPEEDVDAGEDDVTWAEVIPLIFLGGGFAWQTWYLKKMAANIRVYLDRYKAEIAAWNAKYPDVDPPFDLPRE